MDAVSQTPRAYTPTETLSRVEGWLDIAGVTRLADLTGMDNIGIPVIASVRPDSSSLSVDCGKGITKEHARASAAMEALERWTCDSVDVPHFRSFEREYFETRFPRVRGAVMPRYGAEWTMAHDWLTCEDVAVPYYCVRLYQHKMPLAECYWAVSTNGLASGNTRDEAIAGGLFEVIERDAVHVAMRKRINAGEKLPRYNVDSVYDEFTLNALARIRSAGCELFAYYCASDIGIPTFMAIIVDKESGNGLFKGYGCHLSPDVALNRAICEAAQARCVIMAGARDDILWNTYQRVLSDTRGRNWFNELSQEPCVVERAGFADDSTNSADGDIRVASKKLLDAVPDTRILVADFPLKAAPFSVVRVLVPTLEGYFSMAGMDSGERCKQ